MFMTARWVTAAALSLVWLWSAPAQADDTRACLVASEQAQQLRDEGKLKKAREQMLICARDACPGAIRKDCSSWLTALEVSLPTIVISAQDANRKDLIRVQVSLDGKPLVSSLDGRAMTIDPGPHTLRFEAAGQKPVEQTVLIREGEHRRVVSIQFPAQGAGEDKTAEKGSSSPPETPAETPGPTPTRVPVAAVVVGVVGLLGMGSFAYFGITGKNDLATLHKTCGVTHTCPQGDVDATHNKLLAADISLAAGVLALGVGTGLFFGLRSSAKAPAKAAVLTVGAFPVRKGAAGVIGGSFW
jgi:hypothetical protein